MAFCWSKETVKFFNKQKNVNTLFDTKIVYIQKALKRRIVTILISKSLTTSVMMSENGTRKEKP